MEHNPTSAVSVEATAGSSEDISVLSVNGPLTLNNFFEFQEMARTQAASILIVDMTGVPYIDSATLGALVGIHVSRNKPGRKYALVGVNARLQGMFSLTGVAQFLVTYPTVTEAEAALR